MKLNNYTLERLRLLNKALRQLNVKQFSKKKRKQLLLRIQKIQKQLQKYNHLPNVKKSLATASIALSLLAGNTLQGQTFADPQQDPFGIAFEGDIEEITVVPNLADIDNDGDLDLISAGYYSTFIFYENIGTANAPQFADPLINPYGVNTPPQVEFSIPNLADLDGDEDLDLLVVQFAENEIIMAYYENTGTPENPDFSDEPLNNPFGLDPILAQQVPRLIDIDLDGDLDLLNGLYGNGIGGIFFQENIGTATEPEFGASEINPFGLEIEDPLFPAFTDMDGDGDIDMLMSEIYGQYYYYENIGEGEILFTSPIEAPFDLSPPPGVNLLDFADIDGDGDEDLLIGNYDDYAHIYFYERLEDTPPLPLPTAGDGNIELDEDGNYAFVSDDFNFQGFEAGDELVEVTIVTLPENGSLTLNDELIEEGQSITTEDLGNLVFTPDPDAFGEEYATFEFTVSDGEFASEDNYVMTLNVISVNDLPSFTVSEDTTIRCIGQEDLFSLVFTDINPGGGETQDLTIETSSDNELVVANSGLTLNYESPAEMGSLNFEFGQDAGTANISILLNDGEDSVEEIFVVELKDCTGINDLNLNNNLVSISPNPTSQLLHLNIQDSRVQGQRQLEIISINGQSVFENNNLQETTIDISNLPSGTYLVKLTIEKEVAIKKVVVE